MKTTITAELITQRWAAFSEAGRQYFDADAPPSRRAGLWRNVERTRDALNAAHETARDDWARARGWTYDPSMWCGDRPVVDHFEGFVDAAKQVVGFVTHSYATREEIESYAVTNNLNAEFLPRSWWNPNGCIAVLFTRRSKSHERVLGKVEHGYPTLRQLPPGKFRRLAAEYELV